MYQLIKRCYINGILIVHIIETKSILMLLSKNISDSILDKCYAVSYLHKVQFALETMLSLSEMFHDTFTNQKKYNFLCRRLIKKSDRHIKHIKHAYILFVKFIHTFLA